VGNPKPVLEPFAGTSGSVVEIRLFWDETGATSMKKRSILIAMLATLALGSFFWAAPAARARGEFDGNWSVLIVTDSGACDRAYRYALQIVNGRITYPDQSIDINGRVDGSGHVSVRLSSGGQYASGSGRLYGNAGTGRWSGRGSTSACTGHWEAERRG
jgi:hypothetical protein